MPVTHGVAGSSPVRTAEILKRKFRDFLFSHRLFGGQQPDPNGMSKKTAVDRMSAADIGMHADRRKHIESHNTYSPTTHVQKKKKARQSDGGH